MNTTPSSRHEYGEIIKHDISVIKKTMPDSPARKHIISVLNASVARYYTKAEEEVIKSVIDVFGVEHQFGMADEELGELTQAINKIRRTFTAQDLIDIKNGKPFKNTKEALIYCDMCAEIADVKVIIKQLELIFSQAHIDCSEERKLVRLQATVEKEILDKSLLYVFQVIKHRSTHDK